MFPRLIRHASQCVIQSAAEVVATVTVSLMARVAPPAVRLHVRRINGTITRKRSVLVTIRQPPVLIMATTAVQARVRATTPSVPAVATMMTRDVPQVAIPAPAVIVAIKFVKATRVPQAVPVIVEVEADQDRVVARLV